MKSKLFYTSTRDSKIKIDSLNAVLKGISDDGGLFVPNKIPKINKDVFVGIINRYKKNKKLSIYKEVSKVIFSEFFPEMTSKDIKELSEIYDIKNFEIEPFIKEVKKNKKELNEFLEIDNSPVLIKKSKDNIFFLDLTRGKTLAFKDMALSVLPKIIEISKNKKNRKKETLIITATSGDTGKAALEAFKNIKGIKIIVLYPKDGVSKIQKKQMTTQEGNNVKVFGINGNFDDAQKAAKEIFNDDKFVNELKNIGFELTSANSINIGRLFPQVIYYIYAYLKICIEKNIKLTDKNYKINISVPTGNFGNILAAYIAGEIIIPVNKYIVSSNENKVLTDFFKTGVYDTKRKFKITNSPSMDILISSNLERFLYFVLKSEKISTKKLMDDLKKKGKFKIPMSIMKKKFKNIYADFLTEKETLKVMEKENLIDTHSAVALGVLKKYKKTTNDNSISIVALTASQYKFPIATSMALDINTKNKDEFLLINEIYKKNKNYIPKSIKALKTLKVKNTKNIEKENIRKEILSALKNNF